MTRVPNFPWQAALHARAGHRGVACLWFPIDDYATADDAQTIAFVEELARRVHAGSNVYIHCYSGPSST